VVDGPIMPPLIHNVYQTFQTKIIKKIIHHVCLLVGGDSF